MELDKTQIGIICELIREFELLSISSGNVLEYRNWSDKIEYLASERKIPYPMGHWAAHKFLSGFIGQTDAEGFSSARLEARKIYHGLIELLPEEERPINKNQWDFFISHASEDKDGFVRSLALELGKAGYKVWYDEHTLKLGDSLRRSIDKGLSSSKYGIVVLSKHFFKKDWPQKELDGLTAIELIGKKVILPIWHQIQKEDVIKFSPTLGDKLAITSDKPLDVIVKSIIEVFE